MDLIIRPEKSGCYLLEGTEAKSGIVMTVFSTASAVGKTMLSINMSAELARMGYEVCLLDLDVQFGDVANYLHLSPEKTIFDAQEALRQNPDNFLPGQFLTTYKYHEVAFQTFTAPSRMEEAYNLSTEAICQIIKVMQRHFDYVVLDTASAFSELNLTVMDMSTIVTFVGIVDFIPTIKNMKIGYDTMHGIGYDHNKVRFILNRSNSRTRIELSDVKQLLGFGFYHMLPNDFMEARKSIHEGVPVVLRAESSDLQDALRALIAKYTNRQMDASQEDINAGLFSGLKRIFK